MKKNAITVSIDDTKIHKDVEEFRQAIQNLRDLIGPYTIKVKEKEIIIKTKKITLRKWNNGMDKGFIGKFRGTPVIVKPDAEITEIILPKSLATHILQLQDDKMKYLQRELKSIFPDLYNSQELIDSFLNL